MQLASRFGHKSDPAGERSTGHAKNWCTTSREYFEKTGTPPAERCVHSHPSPSRKIPAGRLFSRSSPARPVCAIRAAGNIPNICCVCGGRTDNRSACAWNYSAQLPMTVHPATRCYPDIFVPFVLNGPSAGQSLGEVRCHRVKRGGTGS